MEVACIRINYPIPCMQGFKKSLYTEIYNAILIHKRTLLHFLTAVQ